VHFGFSFTLLTDPVLHSKPLGSDELLPSLIALGTANSMFSAPSSELLSTSEVVPFLNDVVQHWEEDGLEDILGGVVRSLAFHPVLRQGFFERTNQWRGIAAALQELVAIKPIAQMVTNMDEWTVPENCPANELEKRSLLGPLFRMGVYAREWARGMNLKFGESRPC
jgi:ubiquitin conjugation factor E4 B